MTDWMAWLIAVGVLVIAEMMTGTFYLLMIAAGLGAGAGAAWFGVTTPTQIVVAAVIGLIATGLLHRSRFGHPARGDAARDRNVHLDIGQRIAVPEWNGRRARVMYRGSPWDVELENDAQAGSNEYRIVEVSGNRLIVANV